MIFTFGPMGTGKTAALISDAAWIQDRATFVVLAPERSRARSMFKPGHVSSRNGASIAVDGWFKPNDHVSMFIPEGVATIFVDEANMLSIRQAQALHEMAVVEGKHVRLYGLLKAYTLDVFTGSRYLLDKCEWRPLRSTCSKCGRVENGIGQDLLVGSTSDTVNGEYIQVCSFCAWRVEYS